jgi:hypothetical protein
MGDPGVKVNVGETVVLSADQTWYRQRGEPEQTWTGFLESNKQVIGPGTRGGLSFAIVTGTERLLIYAEGIEGRLAAFLGLKVEVRGKQVPSIVGTELWVAAVRAL